MTKKRKLVLGHFCAIVFALPCWAASSSLGTTVFETISPHHHILVYERDGIRTLSFDGSMETRMSVADPTQGHFEYTEYFHMAWLWNGLISNVLVMGLGGASTQRSWERHYPHVAIETVEIDPVVLDVSKNYFHFKESPKQKVHISDGRVFLRRSEDKYGAIFMDAYVQNRYGSSIPYHLATKEFFMLATNRLTTNGVLAYNVIGSLQSSSADIVGGLYRTLKTVFPQVYFFPARTSRNVVIIATMTRDKLPFSTIQQRANSLLYYKRITLPTFRDRLYSFRAEPPANSATCPVLTDDFAPVDGLLKTGY
ncbi:MAG TPA: fused MFS/spermidine synthase [Candidatus Binatia bacterium]|nr:fused MFS/spermidine synthase [Candidatus Binatia bacterium]